MYTKNSLLQDIEKMGINPQGTLLIHSSMKSIGLVEESADTVLDAWSEYMRDGLLIFPTHTWKQIGKETMTFDSRSLPSCVGILPELFRRRPGVLRSLHPTTLWRLLAAWRKTISAKRRPGLHPAHERAAGVSCWIWMRRFYSWAVPFAQIPSCTG